jgi:CheY-like chemotaxis protein
VAHVDDDEDLRAIVKLALEVTGGMVVASCESGKEALETIPGFKPDVILVDVLMPGMNGPETVDALRSRMDLSDVAVAYATGLDGNDLDFQSLLESSSASVIRKPFDAGTLAAQLTRLSHR